MSRAKKSEAEPLAYNTNLRAEIETDVNTAPRARVHSVEWRKIMVSSQSVQYPDNHQCMPYEDDIRTPCTCADRRAGRNQSVHRAWLQDYAGV